MDDIINHLAWFLHDKTGDVSGRWSGRLSATEQRALFGAYCFGKKHLVINGNGETIQSSVKTDYGRDWDTQTITWIELEYQLAHNPTWKQHN